METCRTCAKSDFGNSNDWLDLFHPMNWADEIEHIRIELGNWKFKVTPDDALPQKICTDCFTKFCDFFAFRSECQRAQLKLSNIFDKIEEQCLESGDDDDGGLQCMQLLPTITNDVMANDDAALLRLFEINDSNLLNDSDNDLNGVAALEHSQHYDKQQQHETIDTVSIGLSEATIASASISLSNTAVNNKLNETLSSQQQSDVIEKDFSTQFGTHVIDDDETRFNDIIEEVGGDDDDDDEIERLSREPLHSFIKIDEGITAKICDVVADDGSNNNFCLKFECKYCYTPKDKPMPRFESQRLLFAHIKNHHDTDMPFNCPHCQLGFRDAASRTVHMKDKHVKKHHVCNVCGKKYADRGNLRHHVEKYHSENDFECTLCEKRFYSRKSLKYHMKWHDPELQLKCNYCDRLFINQRHHHLHEATHTGVRKIEYCSFCGKFPPNKFVYLDCSEEIARKRSASKPGGFLCIAFRIALFIEAVLLVF